MNIAGRSLRWSFRKSAEVALSDRQFSDAMGNRHTTMYLIRTNKKAYKSLLIVRIELQYDEHWDILGYLNIRNILYTCLMKYDTFIRYLSYETT